MGWEGPVTHRQYLAWQAWLDEEWNHPNRGDYYAMQSAADVRFKGREVPTDFKLENMRIDFVDLREKQRQLEEQDVTYQAHLAKLRWAQRLGGGATVNRLTPEQQEWLDSLSPEEAMRERRRLATLKKSNGNGTGGN